MYTSPIFNLRGNDIKKNQDISPLGCRNLNFCLVIEGYWIFNAITIFIFHLSLYYIISRLTNKKKLFMGTFPPPLRINRTISIKI